MTVIKYDDDSNMINIIINNNIDNNNVYEYLMIRAKRNLNK